MKKKKERKKLLVFGVDGVLLDNRLGGFKDILEILGKEIEVKILDDEYKKRMFYGPWGLEKLTNLYQGFSEEKLRKVAHNYCKKNLMSGVKELLKYAKNKGYRIGALSSNPQFMMRELGKILGLDFSEGTKLEFIGGVATGKISRKVDRYIRTQILKEKMKKFDLRKKDVIVIGGSITDLPTAELGGLFIAFWALEDIKEKADIVIEKKDLREVIKYI